jgi:nucleoside-diphosphate-sugar epimerase
LLVLGGTHHVGRAVVEAAIARGDDVTTLTRGVSGPPASGAQARYVDRTDAAALAAALGGEEWDAVIDTWSGAPAVVRSSARLLAERAGHYGYVSSESVYVWPPPAGADESAPVVEADPAGTDDADYPAAKRGGELAVLESFGDRALLARAGLILGPYEHVGRLPWWLTRIAAGGRVLAPGPRDLPVQYIDGRDLAAWMLSAADHGLGGAFNCVSRRGHATIGEVLEVAVATVDGGAELVWLPADVIDAAGIEGWTQLPIWMSEHSDDIVIFDSDTSAAHAAGLSCRPIGETVADTWRWLRAEGLPPPGRPRLGLDPEVERRVLDAYVSDEGT